MSSDAGKQNRQDIARGCAEARPRTRTKIPLSLSISQLRCCTTTPQFVAFCIPVLNHHLFTTYISNPSQLPPNMSLPRLARSCAIKPSLSPRAHPRTARSRCLFHRNASTKVPDTSNLRPLVLEQPDKFRPPSHGARKPRKPRNFGPALTKEEIKEQSTKRYPHSMPPEGTVMHKFLTSKGTHVWITMV